MLRAAVKYVCRTYLVNFILCKMAVRIKNSWVCP